MPICIAGMHRSGTSMVARLLKECGLYLGPDSDLIQAAEDNTEGFWENLHFVRLNDQILAALGGGWDMPPRVQPGWEESDVIQALQPEAEALIATFAGHDPWGWKDPRNSLTLPFWLKLIPDLKVIICLRNPVEVSRSLGRRSHATDLFGYNLWQVYNDSLLACLSPENHILTHYDSFFEDGGAELRRLLAFAGMPVDEERVQQASGAASLTMRHHHASLDELSDPGLSHILNLYSQMCAAAGAQYWGGLEAELHSFEQIRDPGQRSRSIALLTRLLEKERSAQADLAQLEHTLKARLTQVEQSLNARLADKEALFRTKLADRDEKIAQRDLKSQQLQRRVATLESQLRALQDSTLFRIQAVLRRYREKLLPAGTGRRTLYDRVVRVISILLHEGPAGLVRRLRARWQLAAEGRKTKSQAARAMPRDPADAGARKYSELYSSLLAAASAPASLPVAESDQVVQNAPVKLIAFYLPQFHPIPENDAWWGRGFTEWSNVARGVPQFLGHHQPHFPGELGFYDLRIPEVQHRQVEIARKYGIHGFCFYYYWFNGKRLLERPLDQFVSDPKIDFPFCLCWANENWTRRWDGQESDILIAQEHSPESDFAFIRDISAYFKHRNYIRINGRPVVVVYRPQIMPDPVETSRRWREYCVQNGLEEPYLVAAQTFGFSDPGEVNFDAAVEFPPHNIVVPEITDQIDFLPDRFSGKIYNYQHVAAYMMQKARPSYPLFRTVMTSWDNTARRQSQAHIFVNSSPEAYGTWLHEAASYTLQNPNSDERLLFINAWNEWAEGAHLEPDRRHGFAFLQKTAEALQSLPSGGPAAEDAGGLGPIEKRHDTAVILHAYYPELLDEIDAYLANLQGDFDLFISVPANAKIPLERLQKKYPDALIYRCENRGRDMAPFLKIFAAIQPHGYKYVCKIHTKKTAHREDGVQWRKDILGKLLGSPAVVEQARNMLDSNLRIGLLAPRGHKLPSSHFMAKNGDNVRKLAARAGIDYRDEPGFNFVAGSMFWFKPLALSPLLFMGVKTEDFDEERGLKDGTLAHAFERFLGLLAERNGFRIEEIGDRGSKPGFQYATPRAQEAALRISLYPVIVYQMGKVGSMSVVDSLQRTFRALALDIPVHHRHLLNELDEIERAIRADRANPDETLVEIEEGKELRRLIDSNPGQCWNLISLVRDPVARNVATFFQNLPEIVPDWKERTSSGSLNLHALQDTFLRMNTIHGAPDAWFDRQLKPVFDIDVYASPFPIETGYKIYKSSPRARLLVLRLEDLDRVAGAAMHDFLGLQDFVIGHTNTTESKEYADIYQAFKRMPLPAEYVNSMYTTRYARHFYSEEELEQFALRWVGEREQH